MVAFGLIAGCWFAYYPLPFPEFYKELDSKDHVETITDTVAVAPMPTVRERLRLVASGRYLYAIGGFDLAGESLTTVERYDPKSNSWATIPPSARVASSGW